jgi:glycosyltransferase involved in cell wall biosynthesis
MNKFYNVTLVIPAKEERHCLTKTIKELQLYNINKIIVIPKDQKCTYIKEKKTKIINQDKTGYGNALKFGINKVKTKYFCIFNADGSFKPNEIENMRSNLIKNKLNFIFASRYKKDGKSDDDTFLTKLGNYFFTALGKIFFSIKITDILYTYVLGETKKFQKLKINSNDFSFCIELPIKIERNKMKYSCIASHERKRISGIKKVNEIKDGFKILCKMIFFFFKK